MIRVIVVAYKSLTPGGIDIHQCYQLQPACSTPKESKLRPYDLESLFPTWTMQEETFVV